MQKQLPFAISLGLNRTARLAQAKVRMHMFRVFDVRAKRFISYSVKRSNSTKARLWLSMWIRDPFLAKHERGGVRTMIPGHSTEHLVQPVGARQRAIKKIRGRNTPRAKLRLKSVFAVRDRVGKTVIVQRKGKLVTPLFVLHKRVTLRPRLQFHHTIYRTVTQYMHPIMERALKIAMRTAR